MAKKKAARSASHAGGNGEGDSLDASMTYEVAVAEVEAIVRKLESGELDLTDSLSQYELGVRRLKECHKILAKAEQKVTLLSGFDVDGNPITEPMPETEFRSAAGKPTASKSKSTSKRTPRVADGDDDALDGDSVDGEAGLF
ncbi:Exodeoxyribonuclease 7 small subunit [Rubripirellula amarantea]|uniref:Exodeoxyribonuclease 7 small subunit n=1 Tax=Rubripirellula amarantea TaxID=2527999 RepID=A0A5C5WG63_9BACT|nr:exodeoxyribonuclease VII small subunit [Rubripirellula amarantea]TWT49095.1 Exodeoxyribonuclease 7 small subunit [Rubripirellula amarantea]